MQIGFIGLGKMGGFMTQRLLRDGHEVLVYDISKEAVQKAISHGAKGKDSLEALADSLVQPKVLWIMVPAGAVVENTLASLLPHLSPGDIIIDGGNSFYKDSILRAQKVKDRGVIYLDVGTSGGVWGLENGYCMMIGGERQAFEHCEPLFKSLAPPNGYRYMGASGAGHFVKMVHNGIEYGLMQAYAEGFEILHASQYDLNLQDIAELWGQGSVVRSWLLELLADALKKDTGLESIKGYVEDSGEGRWTVQEAIDKNIPAPIITTSLLMRLRSRQEESFGAKILAALRNEFGGHAVKKEKE